MAPGEKKMDTEKIIIRGTVTTGKREVIDELMDDWNVERDADTLCYCWSCDGTTFTLEVKNYWSRFLVDLTHAFADQTLTKLEIHHDANIQPVLEGTSPKI